MSEIIADGTGSNFKARVDENNNLGVKAVTVTEIRDVSERDQSAFVLYTRRGFVASATNENIGYLEYTGSGELHIEQITFSTDSTDGKIELFVNPTSVSGGTARVPLNLNRSSSRASEVTSLSGITDITATTLAENEFLDVRLAKNTFTYDFRGALFLKNGDSILAVGEVANIGEKIRTTIFYFED